MKLLLLFLLLSGMTMCMSLRPRNCNELEKDNLMPSQVYTIYPVEDKPGIKVYCDMETDTGSWTVFQRRQDGSLNFYRPWMFYREGFGNPAKEYWLGLEKLHLLTKEGSYQLRVVLESFEGEIVYAQYDSFYIDGMSDDYMLHVSGFTDGGAGDSLTFHNGQKFSTYDKDQDNSITNCARRYLGGFWYNACYHTNPNGIYQYQPKSDHFSTGIIWSSWHGYGYSLRATTMMFRPLKTAQNNTRLCKAL